MPKTNQSGFAQILIVALLVAGLIAGAVAVQQKTVFSPKAYSVDPNWCNARLSSFSVSTPCETNRFRQVSFSCEGIYAKPPSIQSQGDPSSCKSISEWADIAASSCSGLCSVPTATPYPTPQLYAGEGEKCGILDQQNYPQCAGDLVCQADYSQCPKPSGDTQYACDPAFGICRRTPPPPNGCKSDSDCKDGYFCQRYMTACANGNPNCAGFQGQCTLKPTPPPPPVMTEACNKLFSLIQSAYGSTCGYSNFSPIADINKDTYINGLDFSKFTTETNSGSNDHVCNQYLGNDKNACSPPPPPPAPTLPKGFSGLSASLTDGNASFSFQYSNPKENFYKIHLSKGPNFTDPIYWSFVGGIQSPVVNSNPTGTWDQYSCGAQYWWKVEAVNTGGEASPVQGPVTVNCPTLSILPVRNTPSCGNGQTYCTAFFNLPAQCWSDWICKAFGH